MAKLLARENLELARFASKEVNRYSLQAILVTPEKTEATDGHILVSLPLPNGTSSEHYPVVPGLTVVKEFKPFLLAKSAALEVSKNIPKKPHIPMLARAAVLETEAGNVGLVTTDLETAKPTIVRETHGEWPNTEAIQPREKPVFEIGIAAPLLESICKYVCQFGDYNKVIKFSFYSPRSTVKFQANLETDGLTLSGLVMPIEMPKNMEESETRSEPEAA